MLREGDGSQVLPGWRRLPLPFSSLSVVAHENLLLPFAGWVEPAAPVSAWEAEGRSLPRAQPVPRCCEGRRLRNEPTAAWQQEVVEQNVAWQPRSCLSILV